MSLRNRRVKVSLRNRQSLRNGWSKVVSQEWLAQGLSLRNGRLKRCLSGMAQRLSLRNGLLKVVSQEWLVRTRGVELPKEPNIWPSDGSAAADTRNAGCFEELRSFSIRRYPLFGCLCVRDRPFSVPKPGPLKPLAKTCFGGKRAVRAARGRRSRTRCSGDMDNPRE